MFRTKICGVTSVEDARAIVLTGVEAIGLNFYSESRRYVTGDQAKEIAEVVPEGIACVGVFVNASVLEIEQLAEQVKLDAVQLHGDEPPGMVAELTVPTVILARRLGEEGATRVAKDLAACERAGRLPDAVLVDAAAPGQYGGTGKTLAWEELANHQEWTRGAPLILAGGLTPKNVSDAIRAARPHGVDTASGVESAPGKKDQWLASQFIAAAKATFQATR